MGKKMRDQITKEFLIDRYYKQELSTLSISKELGVSVPTILCRLRELGITVRSSKGGTKTKARREKTCLLRYGVTNLFKKDSIKDKIKKTNLEKYGFEVSSKSPEVKNKTKETCIARYGETTNLKTKINKDKSKKTCMAKYGVDHPMKNKKIQNKKQKTSIKRYGGISPFHSKEVQAKIKKTMIKKYSTYNAMLLDSLKDKQRKTLKKNYGVESPLKSSIIKEKVKKTNILRYGVSSPLKFKKILKQQQKTIYSRYGVKNISQLNSIKKNKTFKQSKTENSFYKFIVKYLDKGVTRQVWHHNFILDFYSKKYDIFIQFDGDYWHGYSNTISELNKTAQGKEIIRTIERDKKQNSTIANLIRVKESNFTNRVDDFQFLGLLKIEIKILKANIL